MSDSTLLAVHAAATLFMTGLIWFVQVVHYPLLGRVGRDGFAEYERTHTRLTSFVVGPAMLLEAAAAIGILTAGAAPATLAWPSLALLVVVWAATAFLSVPCHRRLEGGYDEAAHRRLVGTNWIRTAAWSVRGIISFGMLA